VHSQWDLEDLEINSFCRDIADFLNDDYWHSNSNQQVKCNHRYIQDNTSNRCLTKDPTCWDTYQITCLSRAGGSRTSQINSNLTKWHSCSWVSQLCYYTHRVTYVWSQTRRSQGRIISVMFKALAVKIFFGTPSSSYVRLSSYLRVIVFILVDSWGSSR
jgi:hypothetical protein